jgi:hypothetical protein
MNYELIQAAIAAAPKNSETTESGIFFGICKPLMNKALKDQPAEWRAQYAAAIKQWSSHFSGFKGAEQIGTGWMQFLLKAEPAESLEQLVAREAIAMAESDIEWAEIMGPVIKKGPFVARVD